MSNALNRRLVSLLVLWALVFSGFLVATSAARADTPALPAVDAPVSSTSVTHSRDSLTPTTATGDSSIQVALDKMDPSLQQVASNPQKGYSNVLIYTTDMPQLGKALQDVGARIAYTVDERTRVQQFVARPWGAQGKMVTIYVQVPNLSLIDIAALDGVAFLQSREQYAPTIIQDEVTAEERGQFNAVREQIRAGEFKLPPEITSAKGGGSISPTSWAIAREHKALDVWRDLGYDGTGVNVAVIDTGEDFGHPSLQGQWAIDMNPTSDYFGWPIMFHPASMEGLFGNGFWTAGSDWDRLPLPFWLSVNDGDVWYSNTDYRANDSNLDGFLVYQHGTADPDTGATQYTPRANPQQYGNFRANAQSRINRNYWIGAPGDPDQILSASGRYRLGLNRDDTLTGLWGEKVGILLVDSTTQGAYDTVYVDLNFNFDFTDDNPVNIANPLATADLTGDGVSDVSGGLLYFIASSTSVTGEIVIASATGTETSANLANGNIATDIDGFFTFQTPTRAWLQRLPDTLYLPGTTETLYEVFTTSGNETGTTYQLGGPSTLFGTVNIISFQDVDTDRLLRGPDTNFAVSFIYDFLNDATFGSLGLVQGTHYSINLDTGTITWLRDIPDVDVAILYQLETYSLNPITGTLTFLDALPTGWSLFTDYDTGLPLPYGNEYASLHGYDAFIPANGDLVAFHGEFDYTQSHGTFVSSTVVARPFGNLASPFFEVFGTAPGAKIIGIAACCNVPGPVGLFGSIVDQRNFAAVGYDGLPNTGDEAAIISNSFGSTQTVNTGFSFEDRWLYDFMVQNPTVTTLIAFANNGAGYGTGSPGGTSPGVVTVGAGTSGDYRVLYGFDGGEGNYEFPLCPGPPPIDPRTCIGIGAGSGDGPGPYGDLAYFSSRGPTLLGQPKPDVVSIGSFAVEAAPMNQYCRNPVTLRLDPLWCDGNFAFDVFSGTSQATPVTAGITALGVQAYRDTHSGTSPTNAQVKSALKAGADDMHRDILQQGAGWTNALRTARILAEMDGITTSSHFWVPGSYQGVKRPAFVNLLAAGANDAATITVTNHHPTLAKNVGVSDAVMQRMANGAFSWAVSVGTGTNRNYILKSDGIYASDGSTLLMAEPWTAQWNTADFTKVTWTYDSTAFTAATALRLDIFDWYDYQHPAFDFVAEATVTTYTGRVVATGVNGESKGVLYNPATQDLTGAAYAFSRTSVGGMVDGGACPPFVEPIFYWIDTAAGKIVLCAPLEDGEQVTGDYEIYDLVQAGDNVFLSNTGVVAGSEVVFLNSAIWAPANYLINYVTGEFTFNTDLAPADIVEIDYLWDHPGIYDGFSERNRATVAVFGGNSNSVHESFGLLPTKMHDGLVLNIRSGAAAAIPATLIVEFYQKADWTWLTESAGSLNIAAAGGTAPVTVTASVPAGTQPGLYEGAVYLNDGGQVTTIPVVINVPVTGFPITLGGNVPTTSLYDNNGVIQGSNTNSPWRQVADSRYIWADLSVATAPGRVMIYNAILQGRLSDPDMIVFNCIPDANGYTADATYGPCRMSQFAATKEQVGATDTLVPNREFMKSTVLSGLVAFQLKAFGSRASYANGSEPLSANIGIMQATINGPGNPLSATEISTATNRLSGSIPVTVWANVPLYGGLGSAATTSTSTTLRNQVARQDDPNNPYTSSYVLPLTLTNVITLSVTLDGLAGDDLDLFLMQDTGNGVFDSSDPIRRSSAGGTADEAFSIGFPANGLWFIAVHGWAVPGGTTTFDLTYSLSAVATGSAYSLVNAPTTDIPANTAVQVGIAWSFPATQAEGPVPGQIFISPGFAPFALTISMTVTVRYDLTPVTIQDFAPLPGATVRDVPGNRVSVVANVYDSAVRMINIDSTRLWVDGTDVTQLARKFPTFQDVVTCCYNLMTVAYDPATVLADGPHSATLEVADLAGNVGRATWSWTVDNMPPAITLASPSGDGVTSTAALTVSGMAPSAVNVTVNGVGVAVDSVTGVFSTPLTLIAGPNTIDVVATDAAGNAATVSRTVVLDTTGPTLLNVRSSEPSKTNKDSTVISGTAGEAVSGLTVAGLAVAVRADGSFAIRMPLVEGANTFAVDATDLAGNTNSVSVVVTRDTVAPAITVDAITPSLITDLSRNSVNVSGTVTGTDVSLVTVNGIAVTLGTGGTFRRQFSLSLGSNVFVVEAQDDVGNRQTATTSVTFSPVVETVQRSYTAYILGAVAAVLGVVGFLVGWMLKGSGGPPAAPEMAPPGGPSMEEGRAQEPEEMPAEEEMTTEEEEL